MSHLLYLEDVIEKMILLQHFVHGSENYCRERLVGSERDIGNGEFEEYWSIVKSVVSPYTLECSVNLRVLLDTVAGKPEEEAKLANIDAGARSGLSIGQVISGNFELTLREMCNKLIHARKAIPVWAVGVDGDIEFKYWSGDYDLSGTRGGAKWRVILHVAPWAKSVQRFIDAADRAELTQYVGQDWY